jgi:citrate lyase gamma subunit
MNTMPVAYLDSVRLDFIDGRVWEIDVKSELTKQTSESIADVLLNTLQEYKDEIKKIDFKVDISRLKNDIASETNKLF